MSAVAVVDEAQVRAVVGAVPDPELPAVTLAMLGVLDDVRVAGDRVEVDLLPTFAGCPATEVMADDVRAAALGVDGVTACEVHVRFSPPWTSDRITPEGHEALRTFGIAPPGTRTLPLHLGSDERSTRDRAAQHAGVACPHCGSDQTVQDSPFGPTPCRAVHHCSSCRQPFERFKDLG